MSSYDHIVQDIGFEQSNDDNNKSSNFYGPNFLNKTNEKNNDIKTHKEETKENNINLEYQRFHFFCKDCQIVPTIFFTSYNYASYYCNCHTIIKDKINNIINLNIFDESSFKPMDHLDCPIHKEENYAYFCKDCKLNVCRKCIRKRNDHKNHIFEIFDEHFREIDDIIINILNIFNNNNDINLENIKRLMNVVINDYKYFPNYSHFFDIRQCYSFLNNPKCNDSEIVTQKFNYIKNTKDLKKINIDLVNTKKITFPRQGIKDISQIKFDKLINLTELDLSHNSIKSIKQLSKYKLPNLKILNLAVNLIDDSNKEYFFKLDFPELTYFNIFQNRLTDYEILKFNNNKNSPNLKTAFFGGNIFIFPDKKIAQKELEFDFSSVIEIGLKNNVFNDSSIIFLPCFILKNLEYIYLQENNLTSLQFVKDLELPCIKEIWLYNNLLTEFEPLKKFKTLERIEMENNRVNNIEELDTFIKYLPKLKKI